MRGGEGDEGVVGVGGRVVIVFVVVCARFVERGGGMEVETEVGVEDGLDSSCLKGLGFQMGI
jgi:hypothetical protein